MANICDNYLVCEGSKNNLEQLLTYFKSSKDGELELDWKRIEQEAGESYFDHRISFWTAEIENDKLIIHFDSPWTYQLDLFAFLSKKYSLTINYSYCETGVEFLGNAVITSGEIEDYPIEADTEEYWREYYTKHADFDDDLTGMSEQEYLETYSKTLREALELDKEFYKK